MKTQFTPIAMRCTKKQFKAVEPKLKGFSTGGVTTWRKEVKWYLTNNWCGNKMRIANIVDTFAVKYELKVYENWDEATFLKACGIEVNTTPTLEEVKEHFKNAKEVRCVNFKKTYLLENGFYKEDSLGIAYEFNDKDDYVRLYSFKCGYAEIISYKETYTVSKDFILEAHKDACSTWKTKIENQFPELFPKVELEVGKWYKNEDYPNLVYLEKITEKRDIKKEFGTFGIGYGFDFTENPKWDNNLAFANTRNFILATKEEVETALIAEAKKRGLNKPNLKLTDIYYSGHVKTSDKGFEFEEKMLWFGDCILFYNGKWAEIISEPIELSLEERVRNIEEQLKQLK